MSAALFGCLAAALPLTTGCCWVPAYAPNYKSPSLASLGAQSDEIWQRQEANAEASDFVVHQHEFEIDGTRLNTAGEDHLRAVAARLRCHADMPVMVERSRNKIRPETEFKFPIHPDPELDMKRRDMIVRLLVAMGVSDAEQRVIVSPALTPGQNATEAARNYYQGLSNNGNNNYGGSWFGGGIGGGGGVGFAGFTP
jgi:hypothetical protein